MSLLFVQLFNIYVLQLTVNIFVIINNNQIGSIKIVFGTYQEKKKKYIKTKQEKLQSVLEHFIDICM